jgi:hypothetical protein
MIRIILRSLGPRIWKQLDRTLLGSPKPAPNILSASTERVTGKSDRQTGNNPKANCATICWDRFEKAAPGGLERARCHLVSEEGWHSVHSSVACWSGVRSTNPHCGGQFSDLVDLALEYPVIPFPGFREYRSACKTANASTCWFIELDIFLSWPGWNFGPSPSHHRFPTLPAHRRATLLWPRMNAGPFRIPSMDAGS